MKKYGLKMVGWGRTALNCSRGFAWLMKKKRAAVSMPFSVACIASGPADCKQALIGMAGNRWVLGGPRGVQWLLASDSLALGVHLPSATTRVQAGPSL
jgi:hypothetical protein